MAADGMGAQEPVAKAVPPEQYRVLFVLRVVPPDLLAAPAAAGEPSGGVGAAIAEPSQ